jgi:undecaprenyl-diphosphatase
MRFGLGLISERCGGVLNDYILSVVLGIIEGLTEFLPVSSTAHLRIAEGLFNINLADGYWKMYTIVIQLGAILALPVYFRERIIRLISTFPNGEEGDKTVLTNPLSLTLIAFVVTAVPAFLLSKVIGKNLESLTVIGASLAIGGFVMGAVDWISSAPGRTKTWSMDEMTVSQAIWIGACQILSAVFPGTSRSMSTIAGGQLARMSRTAALEFSFFLSIPTMVVATSYDMLKSLLPGKAGSIAASSIDAHGWIVLAIGFLVSFVVAFIAVRWFMGWVDRRGLLHFAGYRILLGIIVLIGATTS